MSEGTGADGELENRVVQLVEQYWDQHEKPLLLSQLGNGEVGQQAKAAAGGLSRFIETRLRDRVRLIQHEDVRQLIGATPWAVAAGGGDHSALLDRTRNASGAPEQRFAPAFWAAFRKPLVSGYSRWVRSEKPVRFEDVREGFKAPQGFVEIGRTYIVDPGGETETVLANIEAWREEKGVELDAYLMTREREPGSASDDLLGQLLGRLDRDEMRRVTMPLDVIDKLRPR